tara:strand:+ start:507 stop:701 length:195 start_codon:yes stop_codon:yes gene_type:complete
MQQKEITKELRYILNVVDSMLYCEDWQKLDTYECKIKFLIKHIANDERRKTMKLYHKNKRKISK